LSTLKQFSKQKSKVISVRCLLLFDWLLQELGSEWAFFSDWHEHLALVLYAFLSSYAFIATSTISLEVGLCADI